jgi:hypothetical protein
MHSIKGIGGGQCNTSSGNYASVLGGKSNTVSGAYSVILGGSGNSDGALRTLRFTVTSLQQLLFLDQVLSGWMN